MRDQLRTDRTYKTRKNAVHALEQAADKLGLNKDALRYVIAVNEEGRFAPVVLVGGTQEHLVSLAWEGVTVVS